MFFSCEGNPSLLEEDVVLSKVLFEQMEGFRPLNLPFPGTAVPALAGKWNARGFLSSLEIGILYVGLSSARKNRALLGFAFG